MAAILTNLHRTVAAGFDFGQAFAECLAARWCGRKSIEKRAQVEACTSSDDGEMPALGNAGQNGAGKASIFSGSKNLIGFSHVI